MQPIISLTANPSLVTPPSTINLKLRVALEQLAANDPSLVWLSLGGENLNDKDILLLTTALQHNTHLTSLDLSNNHITDRGAQAIASILSSTSALTYMALE